MTKKTVLFSIIVLCLAALVYISMPPSEADMPPPLPTGPATSPSDMPPGHPPVAGQSAMAPDFTLNDIAGVTHTLSKLRGKVVMVNFWSVNCGPCIMEIPSMDKLYKAMAGKPFEILAITSDHKATAESAAAKLGMTFPVVLDPDQSAARIYMAYATPTTYFIAPDGTVAFSAPGAYNWADPSVIEYIDGLIAAAKPAP